MCCWHRYNEGKQIVDECIESLGSAEEIPSIESFSHQIFLPYT